MSRNATNQSVQLEHYGCQSPCLVLDENRMERNIRRLRQRLDAFGVPLNPHFKTAKSIEILRSMMATAEAPCTVSTLREAELVAAAGVRRILYAVGIAPAKLASRLALFVGQIEGQEQANIREGQFGPVHSTRLLDFSTRQECHNESEYMAGKFSFSIHTRCCYRGTALRQASCS